MHIGFSGTEIINFLVPKIGEILPHEIKQLESLKDFKKTIKQWLKQTLICVLVLLKVAIFNYIRNL